MLSLEIDTLARLDSPVHQLDARVKLPCAVALIAAVLAVPVAQNRLLLVYAALLVGLAAAARLPARWLFKRMAVLAPFLVLGTVAVALLPRAEAIGVWTSVAGKCALALLGAMILAGTSATADLLRAARAWRVPRTLTSLTGFAITYLAVLSDEAGRMITAMRSRGRVRGMTRKLRTWAAMLVTLMSRAAERADRIALAMVSRGYRGTMPALSQEPVPAAQWALAAGTVAVAGALTWVAMSA
ncbi:MAG: CbiQ family ECF transporter T component [Armatimonadota bacterium]